MNNIITHSICSKLRHRMGCNVFTILVLSYTHMYVTFRYFYNLRRTFFYVQSFVSTYTLSTETSVRTVHNLAYKLYRTMRYMAVVMSYLQ